MNAPDFPAGEFVESPYSPERRQALIQETIDAPGKLLAAIDGLTDAQLDTKYRNWTVRQIVHHVADSHMHSYIRFKWTLTEDTPMIKAYDEAAWVLLEDSQSGDPVVAVRMLEALHAKWVQLMNVMSESDYQQSFVHPEHGGSVDLWQAQNYYPWHAKHHTAQILWLRDQHGW